MEQHKHYVIRTPEECVLADFVRTVLSCFFFASKNYNHLNMKEKIKQKTLKQTATVMNISIQ